MKVNPKSNIYGDWTAHKFPKFDCPSLPTDHFCYKLSNSPSDPGISPVTQKTEIPH